MSCAINDKGAGMFAIANPQGQAVLTADVTGDGGALSIANNAGTPVLTAAATREAVGGGDVGGAIALMNAKGQRVFLLGVKPQGAVMNLINSAGVPVVIAGYGDDGRGGAITVRNGRGVGVFTAGTGADESGLIAVGDADGRKSNLIGPRD
jgi:hypothetical protein